MSAGTDSEQIPAFAPENILLIETLAAKAWPPEQSVDLGGWRLRSARGVTRRANSVWPNAESGEEGLAEKLSAVERYYAALGQPSIFQICAAAQPPDLDEILAARGYGADAHTLVQTAPITRLLQKLPPLGQMPQRHVPHVDASHVDASHVNVPHFDVPHFDVPHFDASYFEVEVCEAFDDEWFAFYCRSEAVSGHAADVRGGILRRIEPAHGFALLRSGGEPLAVGLGVIERGWLGIFCMATLPSFRRRGAASALLHALAAWGKSCGAENAYLQVMQDNGPAMQLYAKGGFVTAYPYHYRIKRA